jgi:hypothetical protein
MSIPKPHSLYVRLKCLSAVPAWWTHDGEYSRELSDSISVSRSALCKPEVSGSSTGLVSLERPAFGVGVASAASSAASAASAASALAAAATVVVVEGEEEIKSAVDMYSCLPIHLLSYLICLSYLNGKKCFTCD